MKGHSRTRFDTGLIFLASVFVILLVSGLYIYQQVRVDPVTTSIQQGKPFAVQLMIHDGKELKYTELLFYCPSTGRAALLDIPGNLGIILPQAKKVGRIDSLYRIHAIEAYRDAIETVVKEEIPFYLELSFTQLERLIDLLGGIEVFVANSLEMDVKGRKIQLPSGNLHLDGGKAMVYLSLQDSEESDIDRIIRIQKFIQSLLKKIGESVDFFTHPDVIPYVKECFRTDMETRGLLAFLSEMRKLDIERMAFQRVLGNQRKVETEELLFPHFEGQLLRQTVKKMLETLASTEGVRGEDAGLTLEILNGTKIPGLARRTREIYQSFGFDVVSYGNAETQEVEKTMVIDRKGNREGASRVASIIKCTNIVTGPSAGGGQKNVDITIVLGGDFDGRYCK
ncbi:MAG: LCP family protein [Spirochaetes bacterium]|nr:LCP family protein [Spirochaetota bacterium]